MQSIFYKDYEVVRDDFANAGTASSDIKRTLSTLGFQSAVLRRIAIASYEAEINLLIHAWGGNIILMSSTMAPCSSSSKIQDLVFQILKKQ